MKVELFASYSPVTTETCAFLWIAMDFGGGGVTVKETAASTGLGGRFQQTRLESGGHVP
jgi:hypothetical protein